VQLAFFMEAILTLHCVSLVQCGLQFDSVLAELRLQYHHHLDIEVCLCMDLCQLSFGSGSQNPQNQVVQQHLRFLQAEK